MDGDQGVKRGALRAVETRGGRLLETLKSEGGKVGIGLGLGLFILVNLKTPEVRQLLSDVSQRKAAMERATLAFARRLFFAALHSS